MNALKESRLNRKEMSKTKDSMMLYKSRTMRKAKTAEEYRGLLNETFYIVGNNMFDTFDEAMKHAERKGLTLSDIHIKVPLDTRPSDIKLSESK